jgi:phage shock protein C
MEPRKLVRSRTDKLIFGVCSGIGRYLGLDTTIVRFIFVLLGLFGGHGLLIYLILAIVMPPEPLSPVVPVPPVYNSSDSPQA